MNAVNKDKGFPPTLEEEASSLLREELESEVPSLIAERRFVVNAAVSYAHWPVCDTRDFNRGSVAKNMFPDVLHAFHSTTMPFIKRPLMIPVALLDPDTRKRDFTARLEQSPEKALSKSEKELTLVKFLNMPVGTLSLSNPHISLVREHLKQLRELPHAGLAREILRLGEEKLDLTAEQELFIGLAIEELFRSTSSIAWKQAEAFAKTDRELMILHYGLHDGIRRSASEMKSVFSVSKSDLRAAEKRFIASIDPQVKANLRGILEQEPIPMPAVEHVGALAATRSVAYKRHREISRPELDDITPPKPSKVVPEKPDNSYSSNNQPNFYMRPYAGDRKLSQNVYAILFNNPQKQHNSEDIYQILAQRQTTPFPEGKKMETKARINAVLAHFAKQGFLQSGEL